MEIPESSAAFANIFTGRTKNFINVAFVENEFPLICNICMFANSAKQLHREKKTYYANSPTDRTWWVYTGYSSGIRFKVLPKRFIQRGSKARRRGRDDNEIKLHVGHKGVRSEAPSRRARREDARGNKIRTSSRLATSKPSKHVFAGRDGRHAPTLIRPLSYLPRDQSRMQQNVLKLSLNESN